MACLDVAPVTVFQSREFRSSVRMQLIHDPTDVIFDRPFSEGHGRSNLPIAGADGNELQDAFFFLTKAGGR